MRVAIYARVSTSDQQSLPAQVRAMNEYVQKRGWSVSSMVKEVGSGAKLRPARQGLMEAARRRKIDGVVVWKLDRWGRSVRDLLSTLNELMELGVVFVSITEAMDFSTATGRAMAGMLGVFAEFERDLIRERIKSGLAEARHRNVRLGRPATAMAKAVDVMRLAEQKLTQSEIARRLKIDRRSVGRIMRTEA